MNLKDRLYIERCKRCLKHTEMANNIGISAPTYIQLEKGTYKHKLSPIVLGKISEYLKIDAEQLVKEYKEEHE